MSTPNLQNIISLYQQFVFPLSYSNTTFSERSLTRCFLKENVNRLTNFLQFVAKMTDTDLQLWDIATAAGTKWQM